MDSKDLGDALKDFMSTPEMGCPWLDPVISPPTASSVAFAWPAPRLQPSGKQENLDYIQLFNLFDINGDGLMSINDFLLLKIIWGVNLSMCGNTGYDDADIAEIDVHKKKSLDLSEFINLLSSLSFKVGEPLEHIVLYQLLNNHPLKQALQQAHINKLIAKFRKNHWGKVKMLMNENKIKDYWMVFSLFDMNGDGRVTTYDFETLMLIWGLRPIDAADMLDMFDEKDGTIDFRGFVDLVESLHIRIGEPLYHFAIFSMIQYHLQIAFLPEVELWKFSAMIRRNFCRREECLLMEYNLRSCKFVFSLFDMDYDGNVTIDDYDVLKEIWGLYDSPLDTEEGTIDFECFFQVFPSVNIYAVQPRGEKLALNLLAFHVINGVLPQKASIHFRNVLAKRHSQETEEKRHKHNIRKILELNRVFCLLDYDEDDHLATNEVELLVSACNLPEAEIKNILQKVDVIWGGRIDFEDLLNLLNPFNLNPFKIIETPSELFQILDGNGDGFLSASDLKRFAFIIGHQVSDGDIQGLMLKLDVTGNGEVGADHFCGAMQEMLNAGDDFNMNKMSIEEVAAGDQTEEIEFTRFWELGENAEDIHVYNAISKLASDPIDEIQMITSFWTADPEDSFWQDLITRVD